MARRHDETETERDQMAQRSGQVMEHVASVESKNIDRWIGSQAMFFDQIDSVARRWLDRRREALDVTRQAMEAMRQSDNLGELFRIQQSWLLGSMQRIAADVTELSQAALVIPQSAAACFGQTANEMPRDIERLSSEALNVAGSKSRVRAET